MKTALVQTLTMEAEKHFNNQPKHDINSRHSENSAESESHDQIEIKLIHVVYPYQHGTGLTNPRSGIAWNFPQHEKTR
jgi:hypothetical protein